MTYILSQYQKDLIVGTLLGDGNLSTETEGKTWRYRALHSDQFKLYLKHKYGVLQDLCTTGLIPNKTYDKRTKKYYYRHYFNTVVNSCFNVYAMKFYKFNRNTGLFLKDVPLDIDKLLTPRALAYLHMDDGALKWKNHSNAMVICTESFSYEGVVNLQVAINSLFGLKTKVTPKKADGVIVGYRLYISANVAQSYSNLIKPYLVEVMAYKVTNGQFGGLGPTP